MRSVLIGILAGRWVARGVAEGRRRADRHQPAGFRASFRQAIARQYLWIDDDGRRRVGWRVWLLIWLLPGAFAITAAGLAAFTWVDLATKQATTGEVVRVYRFEGSTPFDRGEQQFAPVFRYIWTDGLPIDASTGLRHRDWNFQPGSRHAILFDPVRKRDVRLPGPHNWLVAGVIALIALGLAPLSLYLHARVRRWLRAGHEPRGEHSG